MIEQIDADTLAVRIAAWKTVVIDVRDALAFHTARIPEAIFMPLNELASALQGLPMETSLSIVCETGENAKIAAKLLWDEGYRNLAVLKGGFASYLEQGLPVSAQKRVDHNSCR